MNGGGSKDGTRGKVRMVVVDGLSSNPGMSEFSSFLPERVVSRERIDSSSSVSLPLEGDISDREAVWSSFLR